MVELIKTHKVNAIFALAPVMGAILAVALVIL
jgi:hypothetical protein